MKQNEKTLKNDQIFNCFGITKGSSLAFVSPFFHSFDIIYGHLSKILTFLLKDISRGAHGQRLDVSVVQFASQLFVTDFI